MKYRLPSLFALALTTLSPAVMASPEPDKVWVQPSTGLTWARCAIGWDNYTETCKDQQGKKAHYTWHEAVIAADESTYAGYDDWRLPTAEEIYTLLECRYSEEDLFGAERIAQVKEWRASGQFAKQGLPDGCLSKDDITAPVAIMKGTSLSSIWTASLDTDYPGVISATALTAVVSQAKLGVNDPASTKPVPPLPQNFNPVQPGKAAIWRDHLAILSDKKYSDGKLLLVRGGKGPNRSAEIVKRARTELDPSLLERQYALEKQQYAQQVEEQKQKSLQAHADMRQQRADYEQKTIALRKSVKPGDKLVNGTVIAVKGDMVQVQIMKQVCTNYGTTLNSFTRQPDCFKYERVPDGTGWFNRSEILPEKTP